MNKPALPEEGGFVRFRINFGYDGTDFNGFVKQPGLRTVAGELLAALSLIFGEDEGDFGLRVAGRTDAGVHAQGQVAHIDLSSAQIRRIGRSLDVAARLNSLLPVDVRVFEFARAERGFDARYSASFRRYRYRIMDRGSVVDPLQTRYALEVGSKLNLTQMRLGAKVLIGLHDFAAFCKPREGATTIRNLKRVRITRNPALGNVVEIELVADAFCHNMVRSIVGALIALGQGKATPTDIAHRLASTSRVGAFKVVGPQGLSLIEVGYPPASRLSAQAEKAKNKRSLAGN